MSSGSRRPPEPARPSTSARGSRSLTAWRHRERTPITRHQKDGHIIRVTWAKVGKQERGGVERYLANTLDPLEGDRWSNDDPVRVNLPWQ
jgi:hypothetical protein